MHSHTHVATDTLLHLFVPPFPFRPCFLRFLKTDARVAATVEALRCGVPGLRDAGDGPTTVRELRAMGFTGPIIGLTGDPPPAPAPVPAIGEVVSKL